MTAPSDERERAEFLHIYLNDHLAGSAAGTRRARRLADAERDGPDGRALRVVADEIANDRRQLLALIEQLGVPQHRYKQLLARLAEWAGLLKLNGRFWRRSPLSTLIEIEGLLIGVRGKLAGWETMRTVLATSTVGPVELDGLIDGAHRQLDTLGELHTTAARSALGGRR